MKEISEGMACFYTVINIIGTIAITILCLNHSSELDSESESDSNDEITMVLINIIPQIFCIVLLIDFCIDDCCKSGGGGGGSGDCNCSGGGSGDCNCSGGGGNAGEAGLGLLLICVVLIAVAMIFGFFYAFTKGIGKSASRCCSLGTIFFFETLIAIYCMYLYFMDDDGEKYVYIFGVSLGLSIVNFAAIIIPCCRECCSNFSCRECCGECCSACDCWKCCLNCCRSQRKSIINQPIVKNNNIIDQKKDLLNNDFDTNTNTIPITPPSDNSSFDNNNYNYNSSIYNNYKPNTIYNNIYNNNNNDIYNNNYNENNPIDNATKPSNNYDNNIERTGSNYDNAPLPYDLPSEKEILEKYQNNNNN